MQPFLGRKLTERALGLAALICRGYIETAPEDEKAKEMHRLVLEWLVRTGAWHGLEPDEARIVATDPGTLAQAEVAFAVFRSEQLGVVAWAAGVAPMPR